MKNSTTGAVPSQEEIFSYVKRVAHEVGYDEGQSTTTLLAVPEIINMKFKQGVATGEVRVGPGVISFKTARIMMFSAFGAKKTVKLTEVAPTEDNHTRINDVATDIPTLGGATKKPLPANAAN